MGYKKYKPEVKAKMLLLYSRLKYWGNKNKSEKSALKKYQKILKEMERIRANPDSYKNEKLITKSPNYKQILSIRSYISQIKTGAKPNLENKIPVLQERLKELFKSA